MGLKDDRLIISLRKEGVSTVYQKHSFQVSFGLVVLEVRPAQWLYLNLNGKISYLIKGKLNGRGNSDRDNVAQSIVN